jgi:glucose-1-phosphate thymidylyltransferase
MKGIILAGGSGTRLYPITFSTSKQLLPVYDKPMIYYPLSVLMQANIRDILIISTPHDLPHFHKLLKDGSHLGLSFSYAVQKKPKGISEAFIIGESFIGSDSVALILGDNIFYGQHLSSLLLECGRLDHGGMIFGYQVPHPKRYGVVEFDENKNVIDIVEKPEIPPSPYAVTGLYFYDHHVIEIAKTLKPSARGELEITDVNREYLRRRMLSVHLFDRGYAWLDTGTYQDLHRAASFVQTVQERQSIRVGCIEEIAYQMGFIDREQFFRVAEKQAASEYGRYLLEIAEESFSVF